VVRPVRAFAAAALLVIASSLDLSNAMAAGGGDTALTPTQPISTGTAAILHNNLEAGAGGLYAPIGPGATQIVGPEPRNPLTIPPPAPNPQGQACPQNTLFHVLPPNDPGVPKGQILRVLTIYPTFTRNAKGGYDGYDANFGYSRANAIPPGGDPNQNTVGAPASAATVPGHVIGVPAWITTLGAWQDASPTPPYGGSCVGARFSFGSPFIVGNAAPPPPPRHVLDTPPFGTGPQLLAQVMRQWRVGDLQVLPGKLQTAPTYVHIPTCAWLDSNVPSSTTLFNALTSTISAGVTLFLLYDVTVLPGPVTWSRGDGTQSTTGSPPEAAPSVLPSYEPTSQTWSDPCAVSHAYASVSPGRTITATETYTVAITVSWYDGVAVHSEPVPCDLVTGGSCSLTIGSAQGWVSGPHPVDQIEGVPFFSSAP
jgi:hypothetical protein